MHSHWRSVFESRSLKRNKKQFEKGVTKKETKDYTALYATTSICKSCDISLYSTSLGFLCTWHLITCENSLQYLKIRYEWRQVLNFYLQDVLLCIRESSFLFHPQPHQEFFFKSLLFIFYFETKKLIISIYFFFNHFYTKFWNHKDVMWNSWNDYTKSTISTNKTNYICNVK